MSEQRRRGFIRTTQDTDDVLEQWSLPNYERELKAPRETAINYDPRWHPESLAETEQETHEPIVSKLTAGELDEICQSAIEEGKQEGYQAGFEEGKQAGEKQGHEEGLVQGKEAGVTQGLEEGQVKINETCHHLESIIQKLSFPLKQVDQSVLDQILVVATELAKAVIQTEVKTNPQVILNTLKEAIASLPMSDRKVTVYLHPDDVKIVQSAYSEDAIKEQSWHLIADPSLNIGDIQLVCMDSKIDYKLSDRITTALEGFLLQNATPEIGSAADEPSVLLSEEKNLIPKDTSEIGVHQSEAEQNEVKHSATESSSAASDDSSIPVDIEQDVENTSDKAVTPAMSESITANSTSEEEGNTSSSAIKTDDSSPDVKENHKND